MRTQTITTATPLLPDAGPLLDVEEAAVYLGTSVRFPRRLVEERRVRYFKVGRHIRFAKADLDAYLAANSTPAAAS
jgi:excisionase family DNA binding protein